MFHPKKASVVAAVSLTILLVGCGDEKNVHSSIAPPPLKVETVTVEKRKLPLWMQYTGMTKASSDQEIRARVSGRLEKVFFKDGDYVKEGDELFLIEPSLYKSNLRSARAKKERDKATLALAKADIERYKPLVQDGLAPRATLEQYEARHGELVAAIAADEAAIQNAELELSYTLVTAPVSGKVSARRVDVGNLVGYGESTLLTTIMQTESIYAYFSPTESDVQKIYKFRSREKLPAFIEVHGQGEDVLKRKRLDGYVDFSNNTVDPLTSTITMRATIDNRERSVYPGTFVYVNVFVTDDFDFILIPPQSVLEDQLGKFVYTVDANSSARRTGVVTNVTTRHYTGITSGLEDGDRVVISGLMKVKEGRALEPLDVTETKGVLAVIKANKLIPDEAQK